MAKRRSTSKTMKRSKVSKAKRKSSRKSSRKSMKRSKSKSKAKKVSNILSASYGLAAMYKEDEKGYKQQRVGNYDPYKKKKKKMTPPPIPKNKKGKKIKSSSKSAKASFLAGIESGPKQSKGSWLSHVKKVYEEGKLSQPGYKYKDAMKDAKKTW